MGSGNGDDQDWYIDGSDDEKYNPTRLPGAMWQPKPKDILEMFDRLSQDKAVIELRWQCPGRRSPEMEKDSEEEMEDQEPEEDQEEVVEEEVKAPEPSAFDFDDFGTESSGNITPRRMPGSGKTPRTQKRVARMDKVLDDIRRQQMERAAIKEARRIATRPHGSPANARFRLGMTGSPGMTRSDITTTPQRPTAPDSGTDGVATTQAQGLGDIGMSKQTGPGTPSREGTGDSAENSSNPVQAKVRMGLSPKPAGTPPTGTPAYSSAPASVHSQSHGVQHTAVHNQFHGAQRTPAPMAAHTQSHGASMAVHRQSPGAQNTAPPTTVHRQSPGASPMAVHRQSPGVQQRQSPGVQHRQSPGVQHRQSPGAQHGQSPGSQNRQSPEESITVHRQSPGAQNTSAAHRQSPGMQHTVHRQSPGAQHTASPMVAHQQSPGMQHTGPPTTVHRQSPLAQHAAHFTVAHGLFPGAPPMAAHRQSPETQHTGPPTSAHRQSPGAQHTPPSSTDGSKSNF